jgi:hypothetical protein
MECSGERQGGSCRRIFYKGPREGLSVGELLGFSPEAAAMSQGKNISLATRSQGRSLDGFFFFKVTVYF